ncbi:MAG: tetratricopeptide repeat protein [Nannocystis sp.]|nr:tetratricopeptide repeat protein [Nannocystis sp.]
MPTLPQLDTIGALLDAGAADSAVRLLRSAWEPEIPPVERARMYCLWIRGLCDTGEHHSAVTLAQRAGAEFPGDPNILTALGNILDLTGAYEGAKLAFEAALAADPSDPLLHYNLGAILERLGDDDAAERHYRDIGQLDGDSAPMVEVTSALGALLRRQGRIDEAEQIYDEYLDADPLHVDILIEHGICISDLDRYEEAIARFDFALSLDPGNPAALYNKAITLYRLSRFEDALLVLEDALRADPDNPLTLAVLGSWRMSQREPDLDAALSHIYRALDLLERRFAAPIHVGYAAIVAEEIFEALWQNGRCHEARDVARVAARHEWITPHMLDCINEVDHGAAAEGVLTYQVVARAAAGERPEHWPENSDGYTTGLTVIASDEDEARALTLEYLRAIEPPAVCFQLDIAPADGEGYEHPAPRARGVARVSAHRSYNFRS